MCGSVEKIILRQVIKEVLALIQKISHLRFAHRSPASLSKSRLRVVHWV
jgi:hypothetical protein